MNLQTVIFLDLDGTTIQGPFQTAVFPTVLRDIASEAGLPYTHVQRLVFEENAARQADPAVPAVAAMDWDGIVGVVANRLGVTAHFDVRAVANAHAGPPYAWPLDDAAQVLRQLARPGRALVAATNGLSKYQLPVLSALGLLPLFDDVLTPDRYSALKRDLAFYGPWAAAAPLRISVGDTYADDVLAPRRFGFWTIWKVPVPFDPPPGADSTVGAALRGRPALRGGPRPERPDAIIASLAELPEVVERLG